MIVGVDATNIRSGGGLTHLLEVIRYANPLAHDIDKVVIWGGGLLKKLPPSPWLEIRQIEAIDRSMVSRIFWILIHSKREFSSNCDILWSPGGIFYSRSFPYISMSQNMLVFEKAERNRFPISFTKARYLLLKLLQSRSFRHAIGVVFLTNYARDYICSAVAMPKLKQIAVIPHGVSTRFKRAPSAQNPISTYTPLKPFRILYVSIVNYYKHQVNLIEAIVELRKHYPVELVLVGPMYEPCARQFYKAINGCEKYITYKGKIEHETLNEEYHSADLFAFCSTCENMPNILIEAMSSGLPILSSSYGPMPEVLKDGGLYCDPLDIEDITFKIKTLIDQPALRAQLAQQAYALAEKFSWIKCAAQTFEFINHCYRSNKDVLKELN